MRLLYLILLFFILPHLAMASGMPSRKVTIATAIMQEVYDGYEGIAESKNSSSRDFYAQSAGVITDVITKQGSLVKKGDIILKINGPLAEAQYQSATKTLQRSKTLLAKKSLLMLLLKMPKQHSKMHVKFMRIWSSSLLLMVRLV
jgi:multidrug efflux pump subunit AcrA (membrane-fusion protein)